MTKVFKLITIYFLIFILLSSFFSCSNSNNKEQATDSPSFTEEVIDVTEEPLSTENSSAEPIQTPAQTIEITGTETPTETAMVVTTKAPSTATPTIKPTETPKPTEKVSAPVDTEFNVVSKEGLIINEVVSSNGSVKKADDGKYYDIIEIYNNSNNSVNLADYYVSDKGKNLLLWKLPDVTLKAQEYYYFYATGETSSKANFANFSIGSDGEKIYLSDKTGNVIDAVSVPEIPRDMSFGRNGDAFVIYKNPTIGSKNQGLYYKGMASSVIASVSAGVYDSAQTVTLSADGSIYYTTDGSRPSMSSKKYAGESIDVSKSMAIRAFNVRDGYCDSSIVTFSYLVKIPDYELDVVTLYTKQSDFDNMQTNYNSKIEIEASVSYFSDGTLQFTENCGIQVNGQTTQAFDKKSFKVSFKSKYGASKLKYKLFDDSDQDEFDKFVLRSGGGAQASWCAYINDEFWTSVVNDSENITNVYSQLYKPVNLYINGEYWGLYFIREKVNEDFIAEKMGVSASSVSIIVEMRYLECGSSMQGWNEIYSFICNNSLKTEENYNKVAANISLESVADYYILESFCANHDAGNVRVCKSSENDGKWRFIYYDLDYSFCYPKGNSPKIMLNKCYTDVCDGIYSANVIFYKLMQNEAFQKIFFERLDLLISNELSAENLRNRWDNLYNLIYHDMKYNIERWTGHQCEPGAENTHNTMADWERIANNARNTYLTETYVEKFVASFKEVAAEMLKN